jgi:GT2 family glycosyltransferase
MGIKKSSGKYILCLNPDVILDKDYITNIVKILEKNDNVGAATGKLLKYKFDNSEIKKTNIIDSLGIKIFRNHRFIEFGGGEKDNKQDNSNQEVFGVSGAAPIFQRSALEDAKFFMKNSDNIQYFDENLIAYKEDIDLSWRLRHAGWKCLLIPSALAFHDRWETGSEENNKDMISKRRKRSKIINYYSYRNHLLVNLENEFLSNIIICLPNILWYESKKFAYLLLFERETLMGFLDFVKFLPLTLKKRRGILTKSKIKPSDIRRWF